MCDHISAHLLQLKCTLHFLHFPNYIPVFLHTVALLYSLEAYSKGGVDQSVRLQHISTTTRKTFNGIYCE